MHHQEQSTAVAGRNPGAARELGWFADAYDRARRNRTETGERIAAVALDPAAEAAGSVAVRDADALLARIRDGQDEGPVPLLGRTYRRQWALEQQMRRALHQRLEAHPAWPWLQRVQGLEPVPLARLLTRLDPRRASTPSAFWSYCGFATVPAVEYRCATCGYVAVQPVTAPPPGAHRRRGGRKMCGSAPNEWRGPQQGVRTAQPKGGAAGRAAYDQLAKQLCFQVGTALLHAGGAYARFYEQKRATLDRERPEWPAPRRQMNALRKMEKLFLSHLWLAWRAALDLPLTVPHPGAAQTSAEPVLGPWDMVEHAPLRPAATTTMEGAA